MSWYDYYSYPAYVTVAEKKRSYEQARRKLLKSGRGLHPVVIEGRTIARTFWGRAWCDNVESYQDYENRLGRGRSYVRNGAVLDLQIKPGEVTALVGGSYGEPYEISIQIAPLDKSRWEDLKSRCTGRVSSMVDLLQGKLPREVLAEFCDKEHGLFPAPDEMRMSCSCPDYAGLCKHLAAVLYAIGARLDNSPELFFTLRGVDGQELVGSQMVENLTDGVDSELGNADLADVFGVEFDSPDDVVASSAPKKERPAATPAKPLFWTGDAVKALRSKLGWTQKKLAEAIHLPSIATISAWETRRILVSEKYFEALTQLQEMADKLPMPEAKPEKATCPELPTAEQDVSSEKATVEAADNGKTPVKTVSKTRNWTAGMLLKARKRRGLSRRVLAEAIGVSIGTIADWETKARRIHPKYFSLLDAQFPK
ncbi:MAG: helix-turn-helix domain-containing protein [Victivallales bacterium]|nr:helix-turn-helix domain-containing protein [Victivallales bacterium]